jgi:hypothetical protein
MITFVYGLYGLYGGLDGLYGKNGEGNYSVPFLEVFYYDSLFVTRLRVALQS